jgi:hypothetical protein
MTAAKATAMAMRSTDSAFVEDALGAYLKTSRAEAARVDLRAVLDRLRRRIPTISPTRRRWSWPALQWQPVLSPHLLSELETVMRRAKFRSKLSEEAIQDFIAGLADISEVGVSET